MEETLSAKEGAESRLDVWLARERADHSRARWQQLIKDGCVLVDGKQQKPNYILKGTEKVTFDIPEPETVELVAQNIPLDILHEDGDLIVINKQAGMVVHPAVGNPDGTLVNALLFHCKDLGGIGGELRPGIVHRLDKDTSGVIAVAKNESAMQSLVDQFKERHVHKEYLALVWGRPIPPRGTVDTLIGRSTGNRKKMSAHPKSGRQAISKYKTEERFAETTLLRVTIETGRTHQIRVHMTHIGHSIVGDRVYGRARQNKLPVPVSRQMLHAEQLTINHPVTGDEMTFTAKLPRDMQELLEALRV